MTVVDVTAADATRAEPAGPRPQSLATAAARNLATTTKSVPQMQAISPRWLLRKLPWVDVDAGTYRRNRRLTYPVGDGRVSCVSTGDNVRVTPDGLAGLPVLRGFAEPEALHALAERFESREFAAGERLVAPDQPADRLLVIGRGQARKVTRGRYGDQAVLDVLADGDVLGGMAWATSGRWGFAVEAATAGTVLTLPHRALDEMADRFAGLRAHIERVRAELRRPHTRLGEADIELASGHEGEHSLSGTFVDYEVKPREYPLSVAQTVLRVHSRVADLYNQPMNQVEQQLRLTIEALRERQENEMINNRDFGLLHSADAKQRVHARTGPPTPDDLDELLSRRRKSRFFLAHPCAIAAFGRECNRRAIYPPTVRVDGTTVMAWRGVPILPCDKIPIGESRTSSILVLRTGQGDEGVIGLHRSGGADEYRPDTYEPGVNVRFTGIDRKAVMSYLVSTYFSVSVPVPDALGVLDDVAIGR